MSINISHEFLYGLILRNNIAYDFYSKLISFQNANITLNKNLVFYY